MITYNELKFTNNILKDEEKNIVKCNFPSKVQNKFNVDCIAENAYDTESDYFKLSETTDIIKINNKVINLKGFQNLRINNIYKHGEDDTPGEEEDNPGEEEENPEKKKMIAKKKKRKNLVCTQLE